MSLIRVRKRRKKNWLAARSGLPAARLIALLVMTLVAIWYLGWRF